MSIETVRLNARARKQLTAIKRRTGIENWNVLCRWALCISLAEEHPPADVELGGDSAIEMTWKTFSGGYSEVYLGLLKQRCIADGMVPDTPVLVAELRKHLHRGIGYLANQKNIQSIEEFIRLNAQNSI